MRSLARLTARVSLVGMVASLALASGGDVTIHVQDERGRPIAGATVRLDGASPHETRTVLDGSAVLADVAEGAYRIEVEARGYLPYAGSIEVAAGPPRFVVVLRAGHYVQEVQVTSMAPELATGSTIAREALKHREADDVAAALRHEPGLEAVRRGPINLEPTVRGLQEAEVAMLVDGTRTFAAGPGRMDSDLSHVSLHRVEVARVVKGPYALAWGAGAMSAIQLETYRPEFTPGPFRLDADVDAGYRGNAGALDSHAMVDGADDRLRFHVFSNHRAGGDYEAGDGSTVQGDYRSDELSWGVGFRPGETTVVEYTGAYQTQQDIDYPGRMLDAEFFQTNSHALDLDWAGDATLARFHAQVYVNEKKHKMDNDDKPTAQPDPSRVPPFATDVEVGTHSDTVGGRVGFDLGQGAWTWRLGADYFDLDQAATRTISRRDTGALLFEGIAWPDVTTQDLGGYGQLVYSADSYSLSGTLRGDFVRVDPGAVSAFFTANTSGARSHDETNISAAVSARIDAGSQWAVTLGAGRAVRSPTALERYSDRFPSTKFQISAEFLGNPDLDPESSLELDLGLETRGGDVGFAVEVFYRILDDYITVVPDPNLPKSLPASPSTVYRYVNGDRAVFWGGEARVSRSLPAGFAWRATASYVWAEDTAMDEPVMGIAPLRGELALRYDRPGGPWWLELSTFLSDRQERVATSRYEIPTPGWTTVDLRGGWRVTPALTLRAGVANLTNHTYAEHLNSRNPFTGDRVLEVGRYGYFAAGYSF